MEPLHPPRKRPRKKVFVISALLLMLIFFAVVVILFFAFSAFAPSLTGKCVAVVDLNMPLTVTGVPPTIFSGGYPGSEGLAYVIESLDQREDVGAVLLVIDSPGGSVVASREVYEAVKGLDKPKVSYFREVAASGAYYVAVGTDYIISDPAAITGSIGVVSVMIEMSGLFEKIGINMTTITSGKHKDMGSPDRPLTPEEEAILQVIVDDVFTDFELAIFENRRNRLNMLLFENATDGRIMTGRQAVEYGLVDETGNKDDALMKAAELGGIEAESVSDIRICYVSTDPYESGFLNADAFINSFQAKLGVPKLLYQ